MLCLNFWMNRAFSLVTFLKVPHVCLIRAIFGRPVQNTDAAFICKSDSFCWLFAFLFNHVFTDIILQQQSYFVEGGT